MKPILRPYEAVRLTLGLQPVAVLLRVQLAFRASKLLLRRCRRAHGNQTLHDTSTLRRRNIPGA